MEGRCLGIFASNAAALYTENLVVKEHAMPSSPRSRTWLRKLWGAICVAAGTFSILAGLDAAM